MIEELSLAAARLMLARPIAIGKAVVPNRLVMSPMTRGFSPHGAPTDAVCAYYERRARGGCGLIITEGTGVDQAAALGDAGLGEDNLPVLHGEQACEGWRQVAAAVHAAGALIVPQLWHQGPMRVPGTGPHPQAPTLSPSGLWGPTGRSTSIERHKIPADPAIGAPMSEREIEEVIEGYVRSARNAIDIGFDGIAIHGAHGYLVDSFLWEETNRRGDRWGGDRRQRTAFAVEIVRRIRGAIGPGYPIFFRFSDWKLQDFRARLASSPAELEEVLGPLAEAGVDVFDASVRYFNSPAYPGSELNLAGWAKRVTGKLSMAVGGVGINKGMYDRPDGLSAADNLDLVLRRFERGEFDLVAVGRALLGDPHWVAKVLRGERPVPFDPATLENLY